jgi:xanthine/uracil permease
MARTDERDRRAAAAVHPVDEVLPPAKLAVYGFQHVLAFYAGAVIVPILLASAIDLTPEQLAGQGVFSDLIAVARSYTDN